MRQVWISGGDVAQRHFYVGFHSKLPSLGEAVEVYDHAVRATIQCVVSNVNRRTKTYQVIKQEEQ